MSNYFPVIVCPNCPNTLKVEKRTIDNILGKHFRGLSLTTKCNKCNHIFIIADNWKAVKGEEDAQDS